jgi:hypothetical protein
MILQEVTIYKTINYQPQNQFTKNLLFQYFNHYQKFNLKKKKSPYNNYMIKKASFV